jgi:hypothetical protein
MSEAPPDRPIFIVGPHRSGTTVLYRILGRHGHTGYLNEFGERHPYLSWWAAKGRAFGVDDMPREAQRIWDRWKPRDDDVRTAEHATAEVTAWYRSLVTRTLRHRGVPRFLAKYPRLSLRLPWIDAMFPGALYVHLIRDWRSVVASTFERHEKRVGRKVSWFGVHPTDWRDWVDREPAEISTHQFVSATRAVLDASDALGDRYVPLRYDELCGAPEERMEELLDRLGLPWSNRFAQVVRSYGLENRAAKWPKVLGEERVARLREMDPEFLGRFESDAA